jgi:hypothetical protein
MVLRSGRYYTLSLRGRGLALSLHFVVDSHPFSLRTMYDLDQDAKCN